MVYMYINMQMQMRQVHVDGGTRRSVVLSGERATGLLVAKSVFFAYPGKQETYF